MKISLKELKREFIKNQLLFILRKINSLLLSNIMEILIIKNVKQNLTN
jgi:hypothetical protein